MISVFRDASSHVRPQTPYEARWSLPGTSLAHTCELLPRANDLARSVVDRGFNARIRRLAAYLHAPLPFQIKAGGQLQPAS